MNPGPAERIGSCCGRCGGTAPGTFPRALRGTQIRGTRRAGLRRLPLALGGAEVLRLGADSPCFGVWGKGFPCFPGASPTIPSSLPGAGATQPPQWGCQRAGRALSTPSLRVRGVSGALPGLPSSCCSRWEPEDASPSPPALLGTVGPRGGRRDLPRGGYWSAPVAVLGWQLGPCLGSPGFQPGFAPLGKRGGGKQPSFSMQKRAAHRSCQAG